MACQLKEAIELLLSKPVTKKAFKEVLAKTSTSKTPLFDSLPTRSKSPTMAYAGVGSRETPKAILDKMAEVAKTLSNSGYTLRSGGAKGADSAFETGAGKKAIFTTKDATNTTLAIAEEIHPNWKALTAKGDYAAKLMARNTNQVFGENLDTPSDFLLVWTKDAKEVGGTAQAMKMARLKGIPVINMANAAWETELRDVLNTFSILLDSTLILEDRKNTVDKVERNDGIKTGTVRLPSGEELTIYKVASSILTKDNGAVLAARFNRSAKSIYLNDDKTVWDRYFENKNWTKPREQKDGSAAKAIREDAFATQRVMRDFIIQHEVAHYTLGARTVGETIGEYASRINEEAARVLGLKLYDTTSKKADLSSSRAKDMLPWEDDAEYAERKITLKNNGLKATDSDLNEELSLETVEEYEARVYVETLVGEAAKAVVPKKMYHYAQSGTIDPMLKSNKKEKALFFFESRKDAEALQNFLNQGNKDTIGKIFEASANITSVDYIEDAGMLSTSTLIDLTIEAGNKGRDAIVANNMTEMGVGAGKQIGVFDLSNITFIESTKSDELFAVANESETVYNAGTKEALLQLLRTNTNIIRVLRLNKIDLKGC